MHARTAIAAAIAVCLAAPAAAADPLDRAAQLFFDVCVNAFPNLPSMQRAAEQGGLQQTRSGKYAGAGVYSRYSSDVVSIDIEESRSVRGQPRCVMFLWGNVARSDLSDALQRQLGRARVDNLKPVRKGVTLEAHFLRKGVPGRIRVESMGGVSSVAAVEPQRK